MKPEIGLLLAAALLTTPTLAPAQEIVRYPPAVSSERGDPVALSAQIYRPPGSGPFAAVIVLHGCSGPKDFQTTWAKRLVGWGYVAIVPDSFGPRGQKSICEKTTLIPPAVRVSDAIGTAKYLAAQPFVDKGRIGVVGFSHGGWTIMKGVQAAAHWSAYGIKGAVAYYPYCDADADRDIAIPLLILVGDKDDWTPASRCRALIAGGLKQPDLVQAIFYPGAAHGFDYEQPTKLLAGTSSDGQVRPHREEYDAGAARDAENRTQAFFGRLLR
jgi:dienelactone hydrolase